MSPAKFAAALSDLHNFSISDLQMRFAGHLDAETRDLLDRAVSLEDRLFIALKQIPLKQLLDLACDYAEHVLDCTRQHRKYDWQLSSGNQHDTALAVVRDLIDGLVRESDTILKLQGAVSYEPSTAPGLRHIAKAVSDPNNATRHIFNMAKQSRFYFAWEGVWPHHANEMRTAQQCELKWQVEHLHKVVVGQHAKSV